MEQAPPLSSRAKSKDPAELPESYTTELNHSLRFHQTLKDSGVTDLLATIDYRPDRLQHLSYCLKKLRFVRITFFNDFENVLNQSHRICATLVIGVNEKIWCAMLVSNQRPLACEASALPLS